MFSAHQLSYDSLEEEDGQQVQLQINHPSHQLYLKPISKFKRIIGGIIRSFVGLIVGASVVSSIYEIAVGTVFVVSSTVLGFSLTPVLVGILTIGALVYAIKAIRDVYNQNKKEINILNRAQQLADRLIEMYEACLQTYRKQQEIILAEIRGQDKDLSYHTLELWHKKLYKIAVQLESLPATLPDKRLYPRYERRRRDCIEGYLNAIQRLEIAGEHNDLEVHLICKASMCQTLTPVKSKPATWWTNVKKGLNRCLSFIGGVSMAASAVIAVVMLLGNPITLPIAGICLLGSLVGGFLYSYTEYRITRAQEKNTSQLKKTTRVLEGYHHASEKINGMLDLNTLATKRIIRALKSNPDELMFDSRLMHAKVGATKRKFRRSLSVSQLGHEDLINLSTLEPRAKNALRTKP